MGDESKIGAQYTVSIPITREAAEAHDRFLKATAKRRWKLKHRMTRMIFQTFKRHGG